MSEKSYIFVAGASRGLGREIVQLLLAQSFSVKALVRSETAKAQLEALGVVTVLGDALDEVAVEQAMLGTEPIAAVISTIGGVPKDPIRADYLGNKNLIDAAAKAKVSKFILISSIGAGNSAIALPPKALQTLGPILSEKHQAEQYLIASNLNYVIVRPGGLNSEVATGSGLLTADHRVAGSINRADVADLVCQCLHSDRANHRILSAIDRRMIYGQPSFEEFTLTETT